MENETRIELLRRCAEGGNEVAWNELVRQFGKHLQLSVRRCLLRCGENPRYDGVEELVQEVYCRLLENDARRLRRFRGEGEGSIAAYLERVAESAVLDQLRRRRALKRGGGYRLVRAIEAAETAGFGLESNDCPEQRALTRDLLRNLAKRYQAATHGSRGRKHLRILRLALLEGWTSKEIAAALPERPSASSVDSLVYRLRRRLTRDATSAAAPRSRRAAKSVSAPPTTYLEAEGG